MLLFFLVGTLFSAIGLYIVFDAYTFRSRARRLRGRVIGYETSRSKNGQMYHPVVEYDDSGRRYRFKAEIGSSAISYGLNDDVDVLILGNSHSTARLKRPARPFLGFIFIALGMVFVAVGGSKLGNIVTFLLISFLLQTGSVYVISLFITQYRQRQEEKFDYDSDENGIVGHNVSDEMISTVQEVQKRSVSRTAYIISTVIGVLIVSGALYWADYQKKFIEKALHVPGKIVDQQSRYSDGKTTYAAVVLFTPMNESREIRFTSKTSSSDPSWHIGDRVVVLYDPSDVHDVMIDKGWLNYIVQIIMFGIGLLLFLVSLRNVIKKR